MSVTVSKINKIKDTIITLLENYPKCRDNDKLLILKVWGLQNPSLRFSSTNFKSFAKEFLKGNYAEPETIRRTRQKVQQEIPKLRGKMYELRHQDAEDTRKKII